MTCPGILQAHAEWAAALDSTTPAERKAILRLADPTCGIQMGQLEYGLQSYLGPFVSTSLSGISWLTAPHHRQLLQVSSSVLCHPCRLCLSMVTCHLVWSPAISMLIGLLSQPSHRAGRSLVDSSALLTSLACLLLTYSHIDQRQTIPNKCCWTTLYCCLSGCSWSLTGKVLSKASAMSTLGLQR